MIASEILEITAQNQFTDWVSLPAVSQLLISGISNSTVTLQGSPDDGESIFDLEEFTVDTFKLISLANTGWKYRVGVKLGKYGTDTILIRLEG